MENLKCYFKFSKVGCFLLFQGAEAGIGAAYAGLGGFVVYGEGHPGFEIVYAKKIRNGIWMVGADVVDGMAYADMVESRMA